MKKKLVFLVLVSLSMASAAVAAERKGTAPAAKQIILTPDQIEWKQGPASLPTTQMAVLEGDPKKPGFFVMRVKLPAGTKIAPHIHENVERVTVISGAMKLAMGTIQDNPVVLPAGSYFALKPKTVHNAWVDEETILQIATRGPWTLKLVKQGGNKRAGEM